jgi:hypothetical protein
MAPVIEDCPPDRWRRAIELLAEMALAQLEQQGACEREAA